MLVDNHTAKDEELFSYVVASGDMRFIEIAERVLFLRDDPERGLIIRGEVPECGPDCYANLSHILLEHVMGYEDRHQAEQTAKAADQFGQRLAQEMIDIGILDLKCKAEAKALSDALAIVVNSMDVPFEVDQSGSYLRFRLAYCPLHASADKSGLNLWVPLAHRSLTALIETLLKGLAPGWKLQSPAERETDEPLREILVSRD
jgi:hypothetical protein